jgi:O-antigen/teichoic acid export membrane protein
VSIQKKIFVGSLWAVGMRWGIRLMGMGSVVVLARVLRPEDFGIMAMAFLLTGLVSSFSDLGVASMLIREKEISRADIDTAWTLSVLHGVGLACLFVLFAHPAALYFNEPRLTHVIYLCALGAVLGSFEPLATVFFRRELDFARDSLNQILHKLWGVLITIALALWLRSYWALALSLPLGAVAGVVTSYCMRPYRPRFSLESWRKLLGFSLITLVTSLARFVSHRADVLIVGRIGDSTQVGYYNVAAELSLIGPRELTVSVGRAMFPSLAKAKHEQADFASIFLEVLGYVAIACFPMGIGLWMVADDFVRVILGPQWGEAARLLGYLAIFGVLTSMSDIMLNHVLIVTGHERRQAAAYWLKALLLVGCALAGVPWGIEGIAIGVLASSAIMFLLSIGILTGVLHCGALALIAVLWRPVLSMLAMAWILHIAMPYLPDSAFARLPLSIALGAVTYSVVLVVLWAFAGRPAGPEAKAISLMRGSR